MTAVDGVVSVSSEATDPQPAARPTPEAWEIGRRRYTALAVLAAAGVALVRFWSMSGGWFSADDFVHMTRVTGRNLVEILPEYNASGHLNYLSGTLDWALQRVAPFGWHARVWVVAACVFVTQLLWSAVARLVIGRRALSLVTVTAVGLTSLSITALQWWAQAGATAPIQVLTAVSVLGFSATVKGGSRLWAWAAVAILAIGLIGSERMTLSAGLLLATPFLIGLTHGVREAWRVTVKHRAPLLGVVVTTAAYLLYYVNESATRSAQPQLLMSPVMQSVRQVLFPTLLGGPLSVSEGAVTAVADTPQWFATCAASAVAAGITVLALRSPRILIPVTLFAAVWIVWSVALLGLRATLPGVELDWRIFGDLACWLMLVAISCAAILVRTPRSRRLSTGLAYVAVGSALVLIQLHLITMVAATRYWWANPAEGFVQTALDELSERPDASLLDEPLGLDVVRGSLITEERRPSIVFGGAPDVPSIDQPTRFPLVLDSAGIPHLAFVDGGTTSRRGPVAGCGWRLTGTSIIPMGGPLHSYNWLMRVGYLAGEDVDASISSGGSKVDVRLQKGLGEVFLPWRGELGRSVVVTLPQGSRVCLDSIDVGGIGVGERAP